MKIKFIFTIILIVIIGFLLLERSCVSNKLKKSIGNHEKLKITTAAGHQVADQAKIKHEKEKKQLNNEIITLTRSVAERDLADAGREEKLEELEKEEPELENKDILIKNLRGQNTLLRAQRDTAWATIADLGKPTITFSLSGKEIISYPEGSITYKLDQRYLKQVLITDTWIGQFNDERALRINADNVAKDAIRDASRLRLGSKLKTYGVAVLAGILVYSVVRK